MRLLNLTSPSNGIRLRKEPQIEEEKEEKEMKQLILLIQNLTQLSRKGILHSLAVLLDPKLLGIQHLNAGINTVNLVIHDLLQNGDSAQKYMQGSRSIKFDDRLLLDNFVPGHNALQNARAKALQSHSKRSRKHVYAPTSSMWVLAISSKLLKSTHMASQHVTEEAVYLCTGNPLPKDIEQIALWLLNEPFTAGFRYISETKMRKGLALVDIVREVTMFMFKIKMPSDVRVQLVNDLADIDAFRGHSGSTRLWASFSLHCDSSDAHF